jgi:uncharacterized protein
MNLNVPLSDAEFEQLESFLMSEDTPEECMDISMLDGFLTALVLGPETVLPSEWLALVWGGNEGPQFSSLEQANQILQLVMRHMNGIILGLMAEPQEFAPVFYERRDEQGRLCTLPEEWCTGFMQGVALRHQAWQPILEDDEAAELLIPIQLFGTDKGHEWMESVPDRDDHDEREKLIAQIGDCVVALYAYWQPARMKQPEGLSQGSFRAGRPKAGRNDPCPCGSGKKFKKCCGAGQPPLH